MAPPDEQHTTGSGNLEDRLRGLILSNATASPSSTPNHGQQSQVASPAMPQLPPHMRMATSAQKEEYLATVKAPRSPKTQNQPSPRQKRPNQAQRRQMSSQVTVPIDPRPEQFQAGFGRASFNGNQPPGHFQHHSNHQGYQKQGYTHQQHHQPYSPQHQNNGGYPSHSPQMPFSDGPHQMNQYQIGGRGSGHFRGNYHSKQGPNSFQHQQDQYGSRPPPRNPQLFQPGFQSGQERRRPLSHSPEALDAQCTYLESLIREHVPKVGIDAEEEAEKEAFRVAIEKICQGAITEFEQELGNEKFDGSTVELQCFGSMKSGFATKGSDMDLALLTPRSQPAPDSPESRIPRLLEKKLLSLNYGARLLTRTRVPIIKLCQRPSEKLLSDLRKERSKWDNGSASDAEDEEDDDVGARNVIKAKGIEKDTAVDGVDTPTSAEPSENDESVDCLHSPASTILPPQKTSEETYNAMLSSLKQNQNQSLANYYESAKRLLRKLGGRDIFNNSPDLNDTESKILNDVCRAFVQGLNSVAVLGRLRQYYSIQTLLVPTLPFMQRTLYGVWIQIEGTILSLAWELREIKESDAESESDAEKLLESWRKLQHRDHKWAGPLSYHKQLFGTWEQLKKFNSLQLAVLQQLPHEEPVFYFARAERILNGLKNPDMQSLPSIMTSTTVSIYIKGISNDRIRELLMHGPPAATLRECAHEHMRFQFAHDYQHALDVNLFDEGDIPLVKEYVDWISRYDVWQLRANRDRVALLAQIRALPDPSQVSSLKPRDRYRDHLEFPKTVGIQCDINFSAQLAIHNTQLLRCYSFSDRRVTPMVLLIKHWAKVRGINTPYRGTLSSYGYVLMVLHYLVNIAQPYVCPNLQATNKKNPPPNSITPAKRETQSICEGRDIRFWRDEEDIKVKADNKLLSHNHDSLGLLLRGFFEYFASQGPMTTVQGRSFDWGREVLSLKTPGGLLGKKEKGWVGAKTDIVTKTIAAPSTPKKSKNNALKNKFSEDEPCKGEHSKDEPTKDEIFSNTPPPAPQTDTLKESKAMRPIKTISETKEIRHRYLFAIEDPFELDHNVARTVAHHGIVSIRDEFRRAWKILRSAGEAPEGLLDPVPAAVDTKGSTFNELMRLLHDWRFDRGCGGEVGNYL